MGEPPNQDPRAAMDQPPPSSSSCSDVLLVAEPDSLLRWSLATYFDSQFKVRATGTASAGLHILREEAASALIVSDTLDESEIKLLEQRALDKNPSVRIVRVVTSLGSSQDDPYAVATLEKPFELSALAKLLAVPGADRS